MQTNILEYLEQTAPRLPQKIAYSDGTDHMTFGELYSASRGVGSALLEQGFFREPVAILMAKQPRQIASFYGVIYAGCFYVSLDPDMPIGRMELILQTVGARALLVDEKGEKLLSKLHFTGQVISYQEIATHPIREDLLQSVREKQIDTDPIYVVFTSGSTGVPKGVVACHRSVIDYVEQLCDTLQFSEDTVFANQTPLYFDAPLKELMPVIKYGATAYLVPKQLFMFPIKLCDFLNQHRVNTVCWVVSALTMISSMGVLKKNPPKYLHTIAFGSEVFPPRQYRLWRDAFPNASFFNLYGPTEATGMSCYWRADRELDEGEAIPIGRPFRNTDLMLITEDGREARDGEQGEIYLRGTCVTLGYFNNPEKTAEAFVQNPLQSAYPETVYRTGDLAYRNPGGELVFVCRKDAQIKHMGNRIELGEIESAALRMDSVDRTCCLYDNANKRIVLFYVGSVDEKALLAFLGNYLPKYMIPAVYQRLDRMPLTQNGKIDRKMLAEKIETLY
ncbi:MAG: amino acid adenylation domain-containing protein [Clostridia bacterium]|nr:amino acid adenylation domain-containing protein [Clostridia bacterium]